MFRSLIALHAFEAWSLHVWRLVASFSPDVLRYLDTGRYQRTELELGYPTTERSAYGETPL